MKISRNKAWDLTALFASLLIWATLFYQTAVGPLMVIVIGSFGDSEHLHPIGAIEVAMMGVPIPVQAFVIPSSLFFISLAWFRRYFSEEDRVWQRNIAKFHLFAAVLATINMMASVVAGGASRFTALLLSAGFGDAPGGHGDMALVLSTLLLPASAAWLTWRVAIKARSKETVCLPQANWNAVAQTVSQMLRMVLVTFGIACLGMLCLSLTSPEKPPYEIAAPLLLTASVIYAIIVPSSLVLGVAGGLTVAGLLRAGDWQIRIAVDHFFAGTVIVLFTLIAGAMGGVEVYYDYFKTQSEPGQDLLQNQTLRRVLVAGTALPFLTAWINWRSVRRSRN